MFSMSFGCSHEKSSSLNVLLYRLHDGPSKSALVILSFLRRCIENFVKSTVEPIKSSKHLDLYNALIGRIHLDEAIAKGEINHPTSSDKRRKRKDSRPSKDKDQLVSSKIGKTLSKPSSTDKYVNAEEIVLEVAMGADETIKVVDDVANIKEQRQDDATLKQDNSMWFKQDARPETPDPEWH
nr:hypothetical protein [Tanacetum cinerariifolium]